MPAQQGGSRCGTGGEQCRVCDDDACKPLGGTCDVNAQCCDDATNITECHDRHCCKPTGSTCTSTPGCCPDLICARGPGIDPALLCRGDYGAQCVSTSGCADGRYCNQGKCCAAQNFPCEIDGHCCAANEVCRVVDVFGPDKVCCLVSGAYCFGIGENQGCCSSLSNEDQTCA